MAQETRQTDPNADPVTQPVGGEGYGSREQTDGERPGFTGGGGDVQRREEFSGRENVTEERRHQAVDAGGGASTDTGPSRSG
jgi:hypothetical protein